MAELRTWEDARKDLLSDPETAKEYEDLRPQYEVISQIIKARDEQGMTQAELAEKTGICQSNISRLEGGSYNPTLKFLVRIAKGLGMELHIELRPVK
ncbi:MAG: helix-turn-helix domain-containing protein [Lachnospiraceae bacterium]|jgi:DNA-binding XRE family transcriptional regulator